MIERMNIVEYLKKIRLTVQAGSKQDRMDIVSEPLEFEFIFGIGTGGLTSFEFEIAGKHEGEQMIFQLDRSRIQESFQHICLPPLNLPERFNGLYFKFTIMNISPAENREIIRAMAEVANCGDGCCGFH